jgi:hypothetical protein
VSKTDISNLWLFYWLDSISSIPPMTLQTTNKKTIDWRHRSKIFRMQLILLSDELFDNAFERQSAVVYRGPRLIRTSLRRIFQDGAKLGLSSEQDFSLSPRHHGRPEKEKAAADEAQAQCNTGQDSSF